MKGRILFLFMCLSFAAHAQQQPHIQIDSGNKNHVIVQQTGTDSFKKSDIHLHKSDSNTIQVSQVGKDNSVVKAEKTAGFMNWINNTNTLFVLLISVATFIGLVWKGIPYIKRSKVKK